MIRLSERWRLFCNFDKITWSNPMQLSSHVRDDVIRSRHNFEFNPYHCLNSKILLKVQVGILEITPFTIHIGEKENKNRTWHSVAFSSPRNKWLNLSEQGYLQTMISKQLPWKELRKTTVWFLPIRVIEFAEKCLNRFGHYVKKWSANICLSSLSDFWYIINKYIFISCVTFF